MQPCGVCSSQALRSPAHPLHEVRPRPHARRTARERRPRAQLHVQAPQGAQASWSVLGEVLFSPASLSRRRVSFCLSSLLLGASRALEA